MAGFILQVVASSCFALELEESQPVSLFKLFRLWPVYRMPCNTSCTYWKYLWLSSVFSTEW